jgi:hypothetical protein
VHPRRDHEPGPAAAPGRPRRAHRTRGGAPHGDRPGHAGRRPPRCCARTGS